MKNYFSSLSSQRVLQRLKIWSVWGLLLLWGEVELQSQVSAPWWQTQGILNGQPKEDTALATQGQVKNIALAAYREMEARLNGGAGEKIRTMVISWKTTPDDLHATAINLGQLKTVAAPFYDRLIQIQVASSYPWTESLLDDENLAPATIGQVKSLFSFTVPLINDTDGDGLDDAWETQNFGNLNSYSEMDEDGDGLTNFLEMKNGTNPKSRDTDGDGMPDDYEVANFLKPLVADGVLDYDGDKITNLQEYINGTNPWDFYNAAVLLTIHSGNNQTGTPGQYAPQPLVVRLLNASQEPYSYAPLFYEVTQGGGLLSDSNVPSAVKSEQKMATTNLQGYAFLYYFQSTTAPAQSKIKVLASSKNVEFTILSATNNDLNGDGLPDSWEQQYFGSNAVSPTADFDGDGSTNLQEYQNNTDPTDYYNGAILKFAFLSGDSQVGQPNQYLPQPLIVEVRDASNVLKINSPIRLIAKSGSGAFSTTNNSSTPQATLTINTDNTGKATFYWKLGSTIDQVLKGEVKGGIQSISFQAIAKNYPNIDNDGDGILDGWEQLYFGNLNQNGINDFDGDGITNLAEFQQGLNPTKVLSPTPTVATNLKIYTIGD